MKLNPKFLTHVTKGEHYMISTSGTAFKGIVKDKCPVLYPVGIVYRWGRVIIKRREYLARIVKIMENYH